MAKKILLLGKTGLLGNAIYEVLNPAYDIVAPSHSELDITQESSLKSFFVEHKDGFDYVLNCAGYNFVDQAEESTEEAKQCYLLNSTVPESLAKLSLELMPKAKLIQFSSDYVFNGRKKSGYLEDDTTNPISTYGDSKAQGEQMVLNNNPQSSIVRLSWLFGPHKDNFVTRIIKAYKEEGMLDIIKDQFGKPTYTIDVASFLRVNLPFLETGIFHLPNETVVSWYDFAYKSLIFYTAHPRLNGILTKDLNRLAARPKYSILLNSKLAKLPDLDSALKDYNKNYLKLKKI